VPSPTTPGSAADRAARVRFRRALALMVMTLLVPGSAQLAAGDRRVGKLALRIWLAALVTGLLVLLVSVVHHQFLYDLVFDTRVLLLLRLGLIVGAVGWAFLLVDAWRIGQPLSLSMPHRRAAIGVNGALCLFVASALLFGSHVVGVQRDLVQTMFGDGEASDAHHGRYNVLLLGGDSGADRWGLRPDSITIASIDEETGKTVLISLPRNMTNFPFAEGSVMEEQFPDGFDCGEECMLNGVSTWAGDNTELFPKSRNPGVDATIMAVEGITGLEINYWAMVNLRGFRELVDAVGGVTLNVRQPIPVGIGSDVNYVQPGVRKLTGFETQWYARARQGSDDYSRMARQKCVMTAMLHQISPQTMLRNFSDIAKASAEMVSTSIPASEVGQFVDLALKAKGQPVATLSLVPPLVNTGDPDIALIQDKVAEAVDTSEGDLEKDDAAPAKKKKRKPPAVVTGGSVGSLSDGYAANQSEDLDSAC
jgi:polyisoprenyl-teichoic acid--peptidoglycan teichoic acid transferase